MGNTKINYNQDDQFPNIKSQVPLKKHGQFYQNKQAKDTINTNTIDTPMLSTSNYSVESDKQNSPVFKTFEQVNNPYISISNPQYQTEDYEETENNGKKDSRNNGLG